MRSLFLSSVFVALPCLAQTSSVGAGDLSRGLTLPPTGAALADEATAPSINPAGLTFLRDTGGPELFYVHERNIGQALTGDGLFLASPLLGSGGVSLSAQWLRGPQVPSYRKINWAIALGKQELSFGAGLNLYSADSGQDLNGMSSVDLGLASRPVKFLSFGAVVHNVDAPSKGSVSFERRYDLGLGLRPIGDRYTLGVDYLWGDVGGPAAGRLSYALQAEILRGLVISAGFSHGFHGGDDTLFQLGVTLNTPNVGVGYAAGAGSAGLDHTAFVRASLIPYSAVSLYDGKIALVDLAGMISSSTVSPLSLLGLHPADPYLRALEELDEAARDDRLRAVILKIDTLPGGLAHVDELREAVIRLRASGKRVVAVLLNSGDKEYLLASAADAIYAVPQAVLQINGYAANVTFLGGALDTLGVDVNVARVGPYKNAPDQFTRKDMSDEQREAVDALLDANVRHNDEAISQSRQLKPQKLHDAWKEGLLSPQRAWELGLIDEVVDSEELKDKLEGLVPGARFDPGYSPGEELPTHWGSPRQIALIPVQGTISGGKGGADLLLGQTAGADEVIRALKRAEDDPRIAAIVLRVDSPGGDGLASDLIYRAVREARKKKPVVASMGDVAASGGYYVAMGADEIWAEPTTVTGSIGVFVLLPAFGRLEDKLGINEVTVKRGELADILTTNHAWSDSEREAAQRWVNAFYDDFITEVARARHLDKNEVDKVAKGRVWAGSDAIQHGLVDHLGGLLEAVQSARTLAGIKSSEQVEIKAINGGGLLSSLSAKTQERLLRTFGEEDQASPASQSLSRIAQRLGISQTSLVEPGVKALMPFTVHVQ